MTHSSAQASAPPPAKCSVMFLTKKKSPREVELASLLQRRWFGKCCDYEQRLTTKDKRGERLDGGVNDGDGFG